MYSWHTVAQKVDAISVMRYRILTVDRCGGLEFCVSQISGLMSSYVER